MVVISHNLSTTSEADRVFVLEGGRIAESGSHEELLARGGPYARLYRLHRGRTGGHAARDAASDTARDDTFAGASVALGKGDLIYENP